MIQQEVAEYLPITIDAPAPVKIKVISSENRSLFTQKRLIKNKIVIECQPIATALLSEMRQKICNNCLIEKQLTRCSKCKVMYYCGVSCQKQDWKFHKKQCAVLQKLITQKEVAINNIMTEFCLNMRLFFIRQENLVVNQQIGNMASLLDYQPPQKKQKFQQLTTILIQNLNLQKSEENFSKMIKQVSIVSINSFTIQDYLCSYDSVGVGLYYIANFINHSCEPNCEQIFDGNTLKIISLRTIEENEEINISYVNRLLGYQQRQNLLKQEYLFMCFCQRCQIEKMYDWYIFYILCPKCQQQGLVKEGKGKISEEQLIEDGLIQREKDDDDDKQQQQFQKQKNKNSGQIVCTQCRYKSPRQQIFHILGKSSQHIKVFEDQSISYKALKKQFFALKKIYSYNNPMFHELLNKLYLKCLVDADKDIKLYEEAYILLKDLVQNGRTWYKINDQQQLPYFYAWKYAELGKLAYLLHENGKKGKLVKAAEYTQKSYEIISKIHFKHKLPEIQQLKKRQEEMKISMSFKKTEILNKK